MTQYYYVSFCNIFSYFIILILRCFHLTCFGLLTSNPLQKIEVRLHLQLIKRLEILQS